MRAFKRFFVPAGLTMMMIPALPAIAQDDAAAKPEPRVEIIDPGSDDRQVLRYTPKTGASFTMKMKMQMSMAQSMNGQSMPAMDMPATNFTARMTVDGVEDGLISYTMRFDEVSVDGDDMMAQQMSAAMSGLEGLTGKGALTTRGLNKSLDFEGLDGMAPQLSSQANTMKSSIGDMSALLPEEPIGQGAVWKVITTLDQNGVVMQQTSTYTLKALKGGVLDLAVSLEQSAEPQDIENDQVPPDMNVRLKSLEGEASGTTKLDLSWLVPTKASVRSDVSARMLITGPQGEFDQGTDITTQMTITGEQGTGGHGASDSSDSDGG